MLQQRFHETGHTRPLRFIEWNCYKGPPGRDGDIFIYDAVTMSALVNLGFLQRLPDIIDIGDMFNWVIEKSKVHQKTYGIPLMLCANTLICRRKDDQQISNILELKENVSILSCRMLIRSFPFQIVKVGNHFVFPASPVVSTGPERFSAGFFIKPS